MRHCKVCGTPIESGIVVHSDCVTTYPRYTALLAEVERRLDALKNPDLPYGANHNYDEGYRMGLAMAMNVIKDMQAGK